MPVPDAELDPRFSDPDAEPTSWARTVHAIATAQLFWISTTRTNGRPHVSPLVAVWVDDTLHFSTGPAEQKALNLRANPEVALTTGANACDGGLDVVVEGAARRVLGRASLERLAAAWARKWDGRWQYEVSDDGFGGGEHGPVQVFAVRPTKVLAFANNPFIHTRYQFTTSDRSSP